jgi:4-aminobutyrate aminotransferase-like enzyme
VGNALPSPLLDFKPRDNSVDLKNLSQKHWGPQTKDEMQATINDHSMATWTPSGTLKDVPFFTHGEGVYLYDDTGKDYVDLTSQAVCTNLGHTVPESVNKAISDQLSKLPFIYAGLANCEARARLSGLLSELCPGDITGFQFPSSGGEANESAIRIARRYTGKTKIFNHYRSYHGGTTASLAATGDFRRFMGETGGPGGFIKMMGPCPWHHTLGKSDDEISDNCLSILQDQIMMEGPETIAAIMMEGVLGAGGVYRYPTKYVQGVRALCDKHGILLIMDEVMSGFGRSGKMWGHQHYEGVVPDIMTSAKGLSSSIIPLAMVGVRTDIKNHFDTISSGWGSTYHAHPVAMACAHATLKHMIDTDLLGHVEKMGVVMEEEIERLVAEHPSVARGRSYGLFACVDLVDKNGAAIQNLTGPPAASAGAFKAALRKHGVFNLLRLPLVHIAPPLVITEPELRDATQRLSAALKETLDKDC